MPDAENTTPATDAPFNDIRDTKHIRKDLDEVLQRLKALPASRERALSITNLQQSIMWLGMDLKQRGTPNPYPHSYDPGSPVVDPTADNLKL